MNKTKVSYQTIKTFDNIDGVEYLPERTQIKFQTENGWIEVGFDQVGKLRIRAERELTINPNVSNSINIEVSDDHRLKDEEHRQRAINEIK